MNILSSIFLIGILIIVYTYFGYPLFLYILNKIFYFRNNRNEKVVTDWPVVGIFIAAYNEGKVIRDKIENCLGLDYPLDLLEIWIVSDGSRDRTNEIVKACMKDCNRIHLLEFPRMGKSAVLNKAVSYMKSNIVVFSDANTMYAPDALKNLVKHFIDPEVGCVCGRLIYRNPGEVISGGGESFYWQYETALKKMESKLGYIAGANGAIYAIRKELFENLHPKTINDDFTISMRIVKKGFKSIYEKNAVAYEDVAPTVEAEFKRHVRDGAGHYIAVVNLMGLLNPFLGIRSFIYWSHRVLRWSAPFILILLFFVNGLLMSSIFFRSVFILQVVFYLLAVTGLFIKKRKLPFFLYVPFYFCNLNSALFLGFLKAVTGKQKITWESTERIG